MTVDDGPVAGDDFFSLPVYTIVYLLLLSYVFFSSSHVAFAALFAICHSFYIFRSIFIPT